MTQFRNVSIAGRTPTHGLDVSTNFSERDTFGCLAYVDPREESNSPEHMGATRRDTTSRESMYGTTKCDCEVAKRNIGGQIAKRTASCTMCQPPAWQRFPPATTGGRSVDYAVARPKRRERYGDERRSATAKKKTTSSLTPGGLSRPFETQTHSMNALTEELWRW